MALEIKILDYGDIELESSFLVLGRDCGRTRRVPTFGFLILGGTWPVLVDTGYRSNQIMETLGMRGLQSHEKMIENQLKKHGLKLGDVRYVLHTHLHIDHAGKDDLFPMNTAVVLNRRELQRYLARVGDRWPIEHALLGGARVDDEHGAPPQRERGPEYVVVLVAEAFSGMPWLERVYQASSLWDALELGAPAVVRN